MEAVQIQNYRYRKKVRPLYHTWPFPLLRRNVLKRVGTVHMAQIFNEAKNSACHHAGLSNMVCSHAPTAGVLELFSSDYVMPHYYWLAGILGFRRYTAASGGGFDINKNYRMDPGVLRKKLEFLQAR